ncbi:MAG: hypothetical protein DMF62_15195 [Acidobacteria bacterium]|nr:MAG: hypothetical protein DMF62_15195 [Acidobacteriota bacterium]
MTSRRTRLHLLQKDRFLRADAKVGISLHCHTHHSKEDLDFIPFYANQIPIISRCFNKEVSKYEKREGRIVDFKTAYWSPPLTPAAVFENERAQIAYLGLDAFVSITDHDSIAGSLKLNSSDGCARSPISVEWTVPFENGFFHCGVHNLPADRASQTAMLLREFTDSPNPGVKPSLEELFEMLHRQKDVLIVLNHPLWDIEMIGQAEHEKLLSNFVGSYGRWLHAVEVNGFRSWSENKAAMDLAESMGVPLVAGGDRHGCDPNTVINISRSANFEEFIDDVRTLKVNEIVFMPEYRRPLASRQLRAFSQILTEYPELGQRAKWMQRVFFDIGDGNGLQAVADLGLVQGPLWIRGAIRTLGILGNPRLAVLFRFVSRQADRLPEKIDNSAFQSSRFEYLAGRFPSESVH